MKSAPAMSDKDRIAAWKQVTDPKEALEELAAHREFMTDDPYYRDLNTALWEMVDRCLS